MSVAATHPPIVADSAATAAGTLGTIAPPRAPAQDSGLQAAEIMVGRESNGTETREQRIFMISLERIVCIFVFDMLVESNDLSAEAVVAVYL